MKKMKIDFDDGWNYIELEFVTDNRLVIDFCFKFPGEGRKIYRYEGHEALLQNFLDADHWRDMLTNLKQTELHNLKK